MRHEHHLLEKDLYQVVLHRPVEPARLIGSWINSEESATKTNLIRQQNPLRGITPARQFKAES
jgi:hypothetical protein